MNHGINYGCSWKVKNPNVTIKSGNVAKYTKKEIGLILDRPLGNAPKNKKHSFFC